MITDFIGPTGIRAQRDNQTLSRFAGNKVEMQHSGINGIPWIDLAGEWIKMVIAISLGIAPLHFGIYQTLPDGLFGNFFVIIPLFFIIFTGCAYGLMIIDRENSRVRWSKLPVAPLTLDSTG
jgi:hypothetical protein